MTVRLDHVGLVVSSRDEGMELFGRRLGFPTVDLQEAGTVRAAFVDAGGAQLELIELGDSGKQAPHIHHLSFLVEDIDAIEDSLIRCGVEIEQRSATPRGRSIFTNPETSGGIRLQFRQLPAVSADVES
jgi:catechol 2,3-dioxygenase-like lactoylglutathione lyase family enzyme